MSTPSLRDYIPASDAVLLIWLQNFIDVANANLASTGLTAGQMTALNDLYTAFTTAFGVQQAALVAARNATMTKMQERDAVIAAVRQLAQIVQKHPGATDQLKNQLGLTVPPGPPVPVVPNVPSGLEGAVGRQGQIFLKWDKNGNKPGTTYILEMRVGLEGPWSFVAAVTRSKYTDVGREPGVFIQYRVHAVRTNKSSLYSDMASVYGPEGQTPALKVAA